MPPATAKGPAPALAATALFLAVLLAGCTAPPAPAEVLVAVLLPGEGPLGEVGAAMRAAVERAAEEVRASGGIAGVPLRLLWEPAGVDPAEGAAAAQRARDAGARAILGAVASGVTKAALQVAAPAGLVVVSPGSTSPEFTALNAALPPDQRLFFRTVPSDALRAKVAAAYALSHHWSRVALLYDNNPYGNGLKATFEEAFLGRGGNLTSVPFDEGKAGYDAELQRVLRNCGGAGDPDCPHGVFFVGYSAQATVALRDWWARPAWRHLPWLFSELETATFRPLVAEGVAVDRFEGIQPAGTGDRFEAYRQLRGGDPPPFTANAYDATLLLALALEAQAQRGGALAAALRAVAAPEGTEVGPGEYGVAFGLLRKGEDVDYQGAAGRMDFDPFGDVTSAYEVYRVAADGALQRKCLVPEEAVVATPVALPAACA